MRVNVFSAKPYDREFLQAASASEDLSCSVIYDDVFARHLTFRNVLITGHQGFFTREARIYP